MFWVLGFVVCIGVVLCMMSSVWFGEGFSYWYGVWWWGGW